MTAIGIALEINDRLAIQDLLVRYSYAADDKDWPAFEALFTDDAIIDFTAFGGPRCNPAEMTAFLRNVALTMNGWQHTISTNLLEPSGDSVKSRTAAQVMMMPKTADGSTQVMFTGLWYHDLIVRTAQGWKFKERVQVYSWVHNAPKG
jgi:hypothetical protein